MVRFVRFFDLAHLAGTEPDPRVQRQTERVVPRFRVLRRLPAEPRTMPGILAFTAFVALPLAALSISFGLKDLVDSRIASLEEEAVQVAAAASGPGSATILTINAIPPGPVLTLPQLTLTLPVEADSEGHGATLGRLAEINRQEQAVAALAPLLDRAFDHPPLRLTARGWAPEGGDPRVDKALHAVPVPALPRVAPRIDDVAAELRVDAFDVALGKQDGAPVEVMARATPATDHSTAPPAPVAPTLLDPEINPEIPLGTVRASPFRLQLGAYPSEAQALRQRERIAAAYGDLLDGQRLILLQREVGGTIFWRLIAGPFDRHGEADKICRAIVARKGDCFVWSRRRG